MKVGHFGTFWDISLVIVKFGRWARERPLVRELFVKVLHFVAFRCIFLVIVKLNSGWPLMSSVIHTFLFVKSGVRGCGGKLFAEMTDSGHSQDAMGSSL